MFGVPLLTVRDEREGERDRREERRSSSSKDMNPITGAVPPLTLITSHTPHLQTHCPRVMAAMYELWGHTYIQTVTATAGLHVTGSVRDGSMWKGHGMQVDV